MFGKANQVQFFQGRATTSSSPKSKAWRVRTTLATMLLAWSVGVSADELDIAQNPLFSGVAIDPNIMFTLDDSGSMQWEFMPDGDQFTFTLYMFPRPSGLYGGNDYANQVPSFREDNLHNYFGRSAANNGVFYNPDVTYKPWVEADGDPMPDADPSNALYNPALPGLGGLDLTSEQTETAIWFRGSAFNQGFCDPCNGSNTYWPITYYNFAGGDPTVRGSYQRVQITEATPSDATFTSPGGIVRTRDEEIQNFANWFQYSRSRVLAARNGIGRAFTQLPDAARLGFGAINKGSGDVDGQDTTTIVDGVRPLTASVREDFYDNLYDWVINQSGTPLRRSADAVGEYFERSDTRGPWSSTPGVDSGEDPGDHLACRQSFHILMTDGFWNGPGQSVGNSDNTSGPAIANPEGETFQYTPTNPFRDDYSDTLADVAMEYWKRDLRPDLENRVPTNDMNPAFWQHVSAYGVGLGVEGTLNPDDAFGALESGDEVEWPDPFDTNPAKIDDLLHFGLNGRGGFFSAADPDAFADQLGAVLLDIADRAQATTSVSVASTRIETDSLVYAAEFDSEDWSGNIIARDPFENNEIQWQASETLDGLSVGQRRQRTFTFNPDEEQGEAFDGSYVNDFYDQILAPAIPDAGDRSTYIGNLINYLLGDHSNEEQNDGWFRDRSTALGDIVNSQLVFSGQRDEGWARLGPDSNAAEEYPGFVEDKLDDERGVLFVGANDGMLHAFDSEDGSPLFSYAPSHGLPSLIDYAQPGYAHRFFVDGQVSVADAWDGNNNKWRTILVGGYGAGGKGLFALDVTNPESFSASDVLWEIGPDDEDVGEYIGHVYGSPTITRLPGGDFVTVFGNGYNSEANESALMVLDLFSGDPVEGGAFPVAENPTDQANGLSAPGLWLETGRSRFVERAYAGDLNGRMWRFDFDGDNESLNGVALTSDYNDGLLFHAREGQGNNVVNKPITSNPTLVASPRGGLNVLFGTGKFIENSDRVIDGDPRIEVFYALLDRNESISDSDLGEVVLEEADDPDFPDARRTTGTSEGALGWKMDLTVGSAEGERVLARPDVIFGTVIFSTFQPIDDPCQGGGIPRIYVQNLSSGAGALDGGDNLAGAPIAESGAPTAPPTVISPPSPPPTDPDDPDPGFPGLPDPDDPEPTLPGDDETGARQGWCSDFGYISPNTQQFVRLGTLCDGRQIWRQPQS